MKKATFIFDLALISLLQAMGVRVFNDRVTPDELRNQLHELHQESEDIQNRADAEGRALFDEEQSRIDEIFAKFEDLEAELVRREKIQAHYDKLNARQGRQTAPNADPNEPADPGPQNSPQPQPRPGRQFREPIDPIDKNQWGFRSFGDYAMAVKRGAAKGSEFDPRIIRNAPTTVSTEGVGEDGGILVPPQFRAEIKDLIFRDDALIGMTDQMTTSSNNMTIPVDENTPWNTTDGVQCYWEGEAAQMSQSKPNLSERNIKTNKLTALVPVTEELYSDASGLDSYLRRKVPEKMDSRINTALIRGTGAGVPLGILNAPALVTVSAESGQAADTVVFENIVHMWARMAAPYRRNAVWLINQDIEPQLDTMSFEGTSSSVPAYLPANGISGTPYATLKGRPVMPIMPCSTLGDLGDIILADMSQYMALVKTGGVRTDVSIHLWFDYDTMAFRFILRLNGQPWHSAPITPENGSNTLSPFVTLEART